MAQYDFRLRFHLPGRDHINSDTEELLVLQDGGGATVRLRSGYRRGSAIKNHSHASLVGGPYPNAADAQEAAERAKRALLIWAIRNRIGIDLGGFGERQPRGVITTAGQQWWERQIGGPVGGPVRTDVHGVDVYEHVEGMVFVTMNAEGSIGKPAAAFVEQVADAIATPVPLSAKQELAGEILSASYFDASDRSRFITLITAVEALLDPQPRAAVAQDLVARMMQAVREAELDESTRAAMSGSLERLKRESIGQAGRALADRLLGDKVYEGQSPSQFFRFCYELRSSILHLGKVPGEGYSFARTCAAAHTFVCDLVIASFAEAG